MMKWIALALVSGFGWTAALGQGIVKFGNTPTTLVSEYFGTPPAELTSGPPGSFYFGLMTAPAGVTDLSAFQFSGLYATNTAVPGRFQGGPNTGVTVPGWAAGTTRNFLVVGWGAEGGHTFPQGQWDFFYGGGPGVPSVMRFGISGIGTGMAGGTDPLGNPLPPLVMFGSPPAINTGFLVYYWPEPSSLSLTGLGAAVLLGFRRRVMRP